MNEKNCSSAMRCAPILALVIPCYNEEEIIKKSAETVSQKMYSLLKEGKISEGSRILFVDDGSRDLTFSILNSLCASDTIFCVLKLAGNCGHQNAILAGMMVAKDYADAVITIDADLQQDIEAIDSFIDKYVNGCEIVYGIRNDRNTDGFLKRTTASLYYGLMRALGSSLIPNCADYRLVSSKVINALSEYSEVNLFLRGLIPTIGFDSGIVYFDVKKREAGNSKYTFKKMVHLAMDGLTSFSVRPLHMIGALGGVVVLIAVVLCFVTLIDGIKGRNVPGYTTLLVVMLLSTGVILTSLGVIGEYIAKTYMETKRRPHYIIDSMVWHGSKKDNGL